MTKLKDIQDPILAIIYARVSSDAQDVNNSIEAQISECELYASHNNMVVVKVYIDEAESGRSDDRAQFQQMVADATAKDKPCEVILVWKFSRFSRDRVDNAIYKTRLKKRGVRIVSIKEPTDDSPAGQFMESVIEDVDAFLFRQPQPRGPSRAAQSRRTRLLPRQQGPLRIQPGESPRGGRQRLPQHLRQRPRNGAHHTAYLRRSHRRSDPTPTSEKASDRDGVPPPQPKNHKDPRSEKWPMTPPFTTSSTTYATPGSSFGE